MTRDEITDRIIAIFRDEFEIENPGMDDDLREKYTFDSIDAGSYTFTTRFVDVCEAASNEIEANIDVL